MIEAFTLFLLAFLVGYYLGTKRNIKEDIQKVVIDGRKYTVWKKEELKVGAIRRPTNEQIKSSQIPDEKKAGLKAMEETLRDIPELNT